MRPCVGVTPPRQVRGVPGKALFKPDTSVLYVTEIHETSADVHNYYLLLASIVYETYMITISAVECMKSKYYSSTLFAAELIPGSDLRIHFAYVHGLLAEQPIRN